MTVIIANDTPPAIRGILKRWFVEPKPNVFVGTVNRRTRDKVLEYVKRNAKDISLLIVTSESNCQGFKIERWGQPDRRDTEISGLWLVAEDWVDPENQPF
ncbi:MAG TPA: type I-E CRISPR-associated endoribonuclease Cas2e [Candidatus Paceibacterota bacterium]|nr:type I-E CRISPR-associated endoribonuclease Cas2e [Verrucomicrobiota bacterium]HRY50309.1 type I-E CRISPR-associated endoribonuclease Cas2e [Candidatus Paceibacterota bacterium]HSA03771.1 type I-E CRISPR-associated endoribonuclease Cas2e [Candidatus Paceibacterota bacterium]